MNNEIKMYEGNEPYIFISYAHENKDKVLPLIRYLNNNNVRFWYDKNMHLGDEWIPDIGRYVFHAELVMAFISKEYYESKYCKQELSWSIANQKDVFPCYLDDTRDEGYQWWLAGVQSLFAENCSGEQIAAMLVNEELFSRFVQSSDSEFPYMDYNGDWMPTKRPLYSREGLPDYVTFNSLIDDRQYGDERFFVKIADLGENPPSDYLDLPPETEFNSSVEIVPNRTYAVRIIVHNNADSELNEREDAPGMALGVRVRSSFSKAISSGCDGTVLAEIHSSNAKPESVCAKAKLTTKSKAIVHLDYASSSAVIHNLHKLNGTRLGSDYLFSEKGIYLGVNKFSGCMPGGSDYSCVLTYFIRATQIASKVRKLISKDGINYHKNVSVSFGDILTYRIEFSNTGSRDISNVCFHDRFPECLELIKGTTVLLNNANPKGVTMVDTIDKNGFNCGLYGPGSSAVVTYQARVVGAPERIDQRGEKVYYANRSYVDHDFGEICDKATFTIDL